MRGSGSKLSAMQLRFIEEYMRNPNARHAAARAGYSDLSTHGVSRLLKRPLVQAELQRRQEQRDHPVQIGAEWVLARLAAEADADLADLYAPDGTIRPVGEWPLIWRQGLVSGVETTKRGTGEALATVEKIRLCDRIRRIDMIGKHAGVQAFREKAEEGDAVALKAVIAAARERVLKRGG